MNCEAISVPRKRKSTSNSPAVARKNGIGYLPLYSPAPRKHTTSSVSICSFTDSEMDRLEKRYLEGHDVPGDTRYEAWLDMYHHGHDHELSRVLFSPSSPLSDVKACPGKTLRVVRTREFVTTSRACNAYSLFAHAYARITVVIGSGSL